MTYREQNINHYRRRSSVSTSVLITSLADDFLPKRGSFDRRKKNSPSWLPDKTRSIFPIYLPLFLPFALEIQISSVCLLIFLYFLFLTDKNENVCNLYIVHITRIPRCDELKIYLCPIISCNFDAQYVVVQVLKRVRYFM